MALFNNVNVDKAQKMVGIYDLYATPLHYKQYTNPAYAYDINNCVFINNASGTPDQIQLNNLPLLTGANSSYTFNIRGGNGHGISNIINTVNVPYTSYNQSAQKPLKINVGDNYFSNIWVEIFYNEADHNRVLLGSKRFDVVFSTVGNRESFINEDLTSYDAATNSKIFQNGSISSNSKLFIYDINGTNPINPATGSEDEDFAGVNTDDPETFSYPYKYKIHSGTAFSRNLKTVIINKSNPLDTVTYGVGNYSPTAIINNNGNFTNFKGVSIVSDASGNRNLLVRNGFCTDVKFITLSTVQNSASVQGEKLTGTDLIISLTGLETNFFTANDVVYTISDNADLSGNAASKEFNLNSVIGPVNTTAAFNFSQYSGDSDHLDISGTLATKTFWLLTNDPDSGSKFNSIYGNTTVNFHNEYETSGLGYNLTPDISGVNNSIFTTLYDPFLRPVINNSWLFDNTPPVIDSEITLTTGYGTDIYIGTIDNPSVAIFSCVASDDNSVSSVNLQLSYTETNWESLPMNALGSGNYELNLGATDYSWQEGDVNYRIRVRDIYGNETFSPVNKSSDVSISEYSSFIVNKTQQNGFLLGQENLHLRSIIGDPGAKSISIKVYNTSHDLVKELPINSLEEGFRDFYWDGKDTKGNFVEFGTYYIKINVDGILEKADHNTTLTVSAVKERASENEKECALESARLDNKDLNYFRQVRNICINGKLNPATEEDKLFAVLETGVVFYYKTFTPFYKKYLKNEQTDYLFRKTMGGFAEFGRTTNLNSFLVKVLNKEELFQERIAGR